MNGCVIPHTPIAVDFWKVREGPQTIHFLTHLHGDHISGLTSSWDLPIYCSEVTKELLVRKHGVKSDLIHTLQIGCAEIVFLDYVRQEHMVVTALDANHCPGAVMFIMEGYFGTILHTGDFRFKPDMLTDTTLANLSGKVDVLYLDNTYCSPRCKFPTREQATAYIISIIKSHPTHDVLIAMRNLGKEDLLVKIAQSFQEWIYVPHKFYETLETLGAPDVFDCENTELRIRVVPFHTISKIFVEKVNKTRPTIVIMPTALYVGIDARPYENVDNVYIVLYSDHSSFSELHEFVAFLRPGKIIPIVGATSRGPFGLSIADRADMSCFSEHVGEKWIESVKVPLSVQAFMNNRNIIATLGKARLSRKRSKQSKSHVDSKKIRGVNYDNENEERDENTRECSASPNNHDQGSQKEIVSKLTESGLNILGKKASALEPLNKMDNSNKGSFKKMASDLTSKQPKTADCLIGSSQGFEIMNESIGFEIDEVGTPNETSQGTQPSANGSVKNTKKDKFLKLSKAALAVFHKNMESQENQTPIESSNSKGTTDFDQVKTNAKATKMADKIRQNEIRKNDQIFQWLGKTESQRENPGIDAQVYTSKSERQGVKSSHQANGHCERIGKVMDSDPSESVFKGTDTGVAVLEMRNLTAKYVCNVPKLKTIKQPDISKDYPKHSCEASNKNSDNSENQESEKIVSVTPVSGNWGKKSKMTKYSSEHNLITKCIGTESAIDSSKTPTKVIEHGDNNEREPRSKHIETPNILQSSVGDKEKKRQKKKREKIVKDLCNGDETDSEQVSVNVSGNSGKKSKMTKYSSKHNLITKCIRTETDIDCSKTPTKVIEHGDNNEQEPRSKHIETPNILQSRVRDKEKKRQKKKKKREKKVKDLWNGDEADSEQVSVNKHTITKTSHTAIRETEHHSNSSAVNGENRAAVNDTEESKETGNDLVDNKSGKGKANETKSVYTITEINSVHNVSSVELKNDDKSVKSNHSQEIKKVDSVRLFNQRSDVKIRRCQRCEVKAIVDVMQGRYMSK